MTMYISGDGAFDSWLKKAKTGDGRVWDNLYRDSYPMIKSFAKRNRVSRDVVKDIMQDSVVTFFVQVMDGKLVQLTCKPTTYLYRVFYYKWREHCRKPGNQLSSHFDIREIEEELPDIDSLPPDIDSSDLLPHINDENRVKQAFKELSDKCQELLKLTVQAGIDIADVAQRLGYEDARDVSAQKYRCLQGLKKLMIV